IVEDIVVDDAGLLAWNSASAAPELDARANKLGEATIVDLDVSRRSFDIEALIVHVGDGRRAVGTLKGVEPSFQGYVRKDEGTARLAVDGEHALPIAEVVALDEIGAIPAGALDVDPVRCKDLAREGIGSHWNHHGIAGQCCSKSRWQPESS